MLQRMLAEAMLTSMSEITMFLLTTASLVEIEVFFSPVSGRSRFAPLTIPFAFALAAAFGTWSTLSNARLPHLLALAQLQRRDKMKAI